MLSMLLGFEETERLLRKHGIASAKSHYCRTPDEVMQKSALLPKPWVLKVAGEGVFHKTEKKLIALDLHEFEQLYKAARRLEKNALEAGLKNKKWGFVLQSELKGTEFIVGGKTDAVFGKTVLFGSGGVTVELFKDVSIRICPLARKDALEMIAETKASAYFTSEGFRGRKADKAKIVELLLQTSRLLEKESGVESLDFNPVIADAQNARVVDAKITVEGK